MDAGLVLPLWTRPDDYYGGGAHCGHPQSLHPRVPVPPLGGQRDPQSLPTGAVALGPEGRRCLLPGDLPGHVTEAPGAQRRVLEFDYSETKEF